MRFTTLLSTSLALAAGANAMSATYVVNNINQLTVLSSETNEIAKSVSAGNINEKAPVRPTLIPTGFLWVSCSDPLAATREQLQADHRQRQPVHLHHERQA